MLKLLAHLDNRAWEKGAGSSKKAFGKHWRQDIAWFYQTNIGKEFHQSSRQQWNCYSPSWSSNQARQTGSRTPDKTVGKLTWRPFRWDLIRIYILDWWNNVTSCGFSIFLLREHENCTVQLMKRTAFSKQKQHIKINKIASLLCLFVLTFHLFMFPAVTNLALRSENVTPGFLFFYIKRNNKIVQLLFLCFCFLNFLFVFIYI